MHILKLATKIEELDIVISFIQTYKGRRKQKINTIDDQLTKAGLKCMQSTSKRIQLCPITLQSARNLRLNM